MDKMVKKAVGVLCILLLAVHARTVVLAETGETQEIRVQEALSGSVEAEEMRVQLVKDIHMLEEAGVLSVPDISILITDGKTTVDGAGNLECSVNDFQDKAYRPFLVEACCRIKEPWVGYGISGYIFGETADEKFLSSWYRDPENMGTLRLFGLRFFPEWVTAEEGKAARQTAISLASMLIEESGFEWVREPVGDAAKQKWLASIGIEKDYEDEYAGYLNGFQFEASDDYLVKISDDTASYTFYHSVKGARTAGEVETFLYRERYGKEKIYGCLQEEGGDAFRDVIRSRENIPFIRYTLREDAGSVSRLYGSRDQIALNNDVFGHLGYWLNSIKKTKGTHWYHGALVTYMNMVYMTDSYFGDNVRKLMETGRFFTEDGEGGEKADKAILEYMDAYVSGGKGINRAMVDACAAAGLFDGVPLNEPMDATYIEMYQLGDQDMYPGDELSKVQSASFFAWLTDEYTLEKTLSLCASSKPDYEKLFGGSYDELKKQWQNSLRS